MCGIAGIIRFDDRPIEAGRLRAMERAVACRGPDGRGEFVGGRCAMVHTRLAVIDPASGAQPMTRGDLTVVFNGEVYNHRELRRELESLGHRFTSDHSDTEVLLHGYRQWGASLPARLNGMFAFVIHSSADRSLFMARDRIGKKPLYLRRSSGEIVFGSTVAAVGGPGAGDVDRAALAHYLTFGYFDERSICSGVTELPAAHAMTIGPDGAVTSQRYWQPPELSASGVDPDVMRQIISDAVASRLEADVPLGCFLSGGIDSGLIAALAQQRLKAAGGRLKTFTVSMPDARYDEGPAARRVAEHLGADHTELRAEPDVENDLRRLIAEMGEPLADASILPTHWVSRAARQHVTVALSGDGGDELFAGYDRYRAMTILQRWRGLLRLLPVTHGEQKSTLARLGRLAAAARLADPRDQYLSIIRLFSPEQLRELGLGDLPPVELAAWTTGAPRWDLSHYLPFDLLRKVDRASMSVALEVRCPLLDTRVVEAAAGLPASLLMPGGQPKGLLRQIAAPLLPPGVIRRKKMGFAVPIGRWFASELRPMLSRWLLESPGLTDLGFRRAAMEQMIADHASGKADHSHRLFALLSLSMWTRSKAEH